MLTKVSIIGTWVVELFVLQNIIERLLCFAKQSLSELILFKTKLNINFSQKTTNVTFHPLLEMKNFKDCQRAIRNF